jgi:alpha-L-fucosidase
MPIAPGPFTPDWDSLRAYQCPEWFRDAKFGIWAHWSPQCVPEQGDWYARRMYIQGNPAYEYHVKHYGHPSKFGYKDICNLWKAENWEPEELIKLYKHAGARYFVALANHHGNFDAWNSAHQPWNSVNVGPRKDIVGIWAKTARKHGLRFGVSYHSTPGRTWGQFMPYWYGSDKEGPLAGVPYDGAVLTKADGKGQWWEGLDPRDLYGPPHKPSSRDESYMRNFLLRVWDLVAKYQVDLLYFDDTLQWDWDQKIYLGLQDVAPQIAAHFYNSLMRSKDRKTDAVLNFKQVPDALQSALVWDFERRRAEKLQPHPWQTDTCIGQWHYRRGIKYVPAGRVIHQLMDVVSKNGNLLLSIPIRGNGTIDGDERKIVEDIGAWMNLNGESVYNTRPAQIHGEGPVQDWKQPFTSEHIRFTTKGKTLYATALGWPATGKLLIRSLGSQAGKVSRLSLLGYQGRLQYSQSPAGLAITLPAQKPCEHAFVFKLEGRDLKPALL